MKVNVTILSCANDPKIDRLVFGDWWWGVYIPGSYFPKKKGFARSEEAAKRKADKAAKSLVPAPSQTYTLEV